MDKLKRYFPCKVEFRAEGDTPDKKGFGHFLVFNQLTELWPGFREQIAPGALDEVMEDDVAVMTNHETNMILARTSAGTAKIGEDESGGWVEWDFPNTTAGNDTKENMRNGNITGMSFGFTVKEDRIEHDRESDIVTRTILKLERLYDASPVVFPAYIQTDAGFREEMENRPDWPVKENPHDDMAYKIEAEQKSKKLKILSH